VHILADSTNPGFSYFNTVTTDQNGFYTDSLLIPNGTQILFNVYTFDCINVIHQSNLISANPPLIADFQICDSITNNCNSLFTIVSDSLNPYAFYFMDLSSGNPNVWLWDFGDGTTSTMQNPTHLYSSSGVFQVCLTIINTDSLNYCTSTSCDFVVVDTLFPCIAHFLYSRSRNPPRDWKFFNSKKSDAYICRYWNVFCLSDSLEGDSGNGFLL